MTSTAGENRPVPPADLSAAHASVTLLERLADKLGARASIRAVYGEPVTSGNITVIPSPRSPTASAASAATPRQPRTEKAAEDPRPDPAASS